MAVEMAEVLRQTRGRALGPLTRASAGRVSTDTRLLEKNDLFFALVGSRFDGHDFIAEALEKGAAHFVVSNPQKVKPVWLKEADFIAVEDTLTAYGDLARHVRQKYKIPAIAVTGSAGKTTVKELLAHLLSSKFKVLKNRGTENNLVGVPKTLLQLDESFQAIVLEMGTSSPGEIERLSSIIRPQAAVLTQIGASHLEGLKDLEGVRAEKLKVLKHLDRGGLLAVNGENPFLADIQSGVHRLVRVGFPPAPGDRPRSDVMAERITEGPCGTEFFWNGLKMETALIGRHNVLNCLLALQCASALGVGPQALQKSLASFKPVPGRLAFKNISDITFLDDSYNSNPVSFRAAVETLCGLKTRGRKGVVCGDMLELGSQSEALHREIGALLARSELDFVVAAGVRCAALVDEALKQGFHRDRIFHARDSAEAGKRCRKLASGGDTVLVKGSRLMQMEKIWRFFE